MTEPTGTTHAAKCRSGANRTGNVCGDRRFIASCPGIEAYRDDCYP